MLTNVLMNLFFQSWDFLFRCHAMEGQPKQWQVITTFLWFKLNISSINASTFDEKKHFKRIF